MYKQDLALNNLQWLICHKTQPNQTKLMYGCASVGQPAKTYQHCADTG